MVSNFLKALERHSSLMVTVVGSAINFVCTGLMGYLVLEERLGVRWIAGASLIVMGILLIVLSQGVADIKKTSN
jgi:drug/metabolite transporter (DMT)-like permease